MNVLLFATNQKYKVSKKIARIRCTQCLAAFLEIIACYAGCWYIFIYGLSLIVEDSHFDSHS